MSRSSRFASISGAVSTMMSSMSPDQLEPLVEVLAVEAEPLAEQLHEIDDLEAAAVAGVADLAVAGMIDRRQRRRPRHRRPPPARAAPARA